MNDKDNSSSTAANDNNSKNNKTVGNSTIGLVKYQLMSVQIFLQTVLKFGN